MSDTKLGQIIANGLLGILSVSVQTCRDVALMACSIVSQECMGTILQEFYQVAFRRKIYRSIEELQTDLDEWLVYYNHDRTHQWMMCCGRIPMQTCVTERRRGTIK